MSHETWTGATGSKSQVKDRLGQGPTGQSDPGHQDEHNFASTRPLSMEAV